MWNKNLVRLFGVLMAVALTAAACGSTTTTGTADADPSEDDTSEESAEEADDTMEDMEEEHAEGEHDDHAEGEHGDDHAEGDEHEDEHSHDHTNVLEVDATLPIPAVAIDLAETATAGTFALTVSLENFTITPENVDGDPIDNEGHMHLLIDGVKIERFTDLEREVQVSEGEHLVEVELNANNHAAYAVDGEPIRAGVTVTGAGEAPAGLTAADASVTITAAIVGGEVATDEDRVEVAIGDVVMVMISSDAEDEVHVHGYDLFADVADGADAMIVFEADTPGRFEIELETSGLFIAELVVS